MKIRMVKLFGGPCDGVTTMASHDTSWHQGELYVYAGGEDPSLFQHAVSVIGALPTKQMLEEKSRVMDWMDSPTVEAGGFQLPRPLSDLIPIPPWRINLWLQLIRTLA